jgi:hypothetical protein
MRRGVNVGIRFGTMQRLPRNGWYAARRRPRVRLGVSDIAKRYSRMTPDQIAEAKRMAREWMAKHQR